MSTPTHSKEREEKLNWAHKDEWRVFGDNFCITITRHSGTPIDRSEGRNKWAVYAYVYPEHPLFDELKDKDMFTTGLPFHCGGSFFQKHESEGKITAIQVGADYNHLHDAHYTHYVTREDAGEIFEDAEELFKHLQEIAVPTDRGGEG